MADLIIKPTTGSGNKLIIQTEDGTPIVTTSDSGAALSAAVSGGGSTNASDLISGTLPDARFPATLPAVNGSALTNLPAAGWVKLDEVVKSSYNTTAIRIGDDTTLTTTYKWYKVLMTDMFPPAHHHGSFRIRFYDDSNTIQTNNYEQAVTYLNTGDGEGGPGLQWGIANYWGNGDSQIGLGYPTFGFDTFGDGKWEFNASWEFQNPRTSKYHHMIGSGHFRDNDYDKQGMMHFIMGRQNNQVLEGFDIQGWNDDGNNEDFSGTVTLYGLSA